MTLERAFEIARAGKCRGMTELRSQLMREGFRDHERALFGVAMRQELRALMARKGGRDDDTR